MALWRRIGWVGIFTSVMAPRDLFRDPTGHPVIGHRGASGLLPENTLAAFALARAQGADGLEFDIRLTADGVPVVHHDPTLDRTTSLTGPLAARTARELAAADAGGGEGVPTAEAAFEATGELPLMIELKVAEAALPLLAAIRRCGVEHRVAVASFFPAALAPLGGSGLLLGADRRQIALAALGAALGWPAGRVPFGFYAVPDRWRGLIPVPTGRFVRRAGQQGCPVHVWTVDDPQEARRLWQLGVAGVLTNRPDLILAERDGARPNPAARRGPPLG